MDEVVQILQSDLWIPLQFSFDWEIEMLIQGLAYIFMKNML